ncbi:MAG TPA: 1-(5-phosphoribosyl)-5-[(5-phosphoribosylamino)methylideneamino]imidazole-4-carboxamide isomerase [Ktedonobacter sp.]|nr:1-(5-phosphoribosyl)-5-[(5-phosphoribosylamino)methylideneamino]imidazole-4-carboxamide isomerase [Ktedonobacter sp.]
MIILPAIDIKDGQCVRLYQGDYAQVTTYDSDPVQVAVRWQKSGASWLHIVDLDGAAQGHPVNTLLLQQIRNATSHRIQVGGGLRTLEHIEHVLSIGVERVILGTIAITNRPLLQDALERYGERIVVGLDARDGKVAIEGWRETSEVKAVDLAAELSTLGVRRFIYTDIARDGSLQGPNLEGLAKMQEAIIHSNSSYSLIASGGVSSLADLRVLAALGVEGAIVGKALYTGQIDLHKAVHELER